MARKSAKIPGALRRTKAFVIFNVVLWGVIGGWYLFQPKARQEEVAQLTRNLFDGKKDISAVDLAWDLWQLYSGRDFVAAPAPGDHTFFYAGAPVGGVVRVLTNTGYAVGYSDTLGNPLWAAYRLGDVDQLQAPPRPDDFVADSRTVARIDSGVYSRSGYDRGHMAPNYGIATRFGRKGQEETFLMSNIVPQKHGLNAGLWEDLEHRIATSYPARFKEVWVLAGPIFSAKPARLHQRVAIPDAFYMIIVDESDGRVRAEAFILPQEPAERDLSRYLVSIDEIERRTGLDFFSALPDDAETALEAREVGRVW